MGNRIRELRRQRKWSFEDVAKRIGSSTSASTVQKLENGTMQLTQTWMHKLAAAFGVEVIEILAAAPQQIPPASIAEIYGPDVELINAALGSIGVSDRQRFKVLSKALEELGLILGDEIEVEPCANTRELATGDIVVAQSIPAEGELEHLILREYVEPNLLITNARHENARPLHLASGLVRILGRVTAAHRNVNRAR